MGAWWPSTVADQPGKYSSDNTNRPGQWLVTWIVTFVDEYDVMFAVLVGSPLQRGSSAALGPAFDDRARLGSKCRTCTEPSGNRSGFSLVRTWIAGVHVGNRTEIVHDERARRRVQVLEDLHIARLGRRGGTATPVGGGFDVGALVYSR